MEKYAVITGASSGIGAEFARILAEKGYCLILVARRETRLHALASELNTKCEIVPADLSQEEECYRLFDKIKEKEIGIFINNAGFGDCNFFLQGDIEKELTMIQVNVKAVHLLTKLALQHMQKQDTGYVLNVASSAGLIPGGPYMATYYATKAYITSLTLAIAQELKESQSHLYIGCLCPGPVNTEFNRRANVEFALKGISARRCASYALDKMWKRKTVIIPGVMLKCGLTLGRFLPRTCFVRIAGHQQKKKIIRK